MEVVDSKLQNHLIQFFILASAAKARIEMSVEPPKKAS
jgi:hypothetical protein